MAKGEEYDNRRLAKIRRKALIGRLESSMGAKSLGELQDMTYGEKIRFMLTSGWILNAWYEKLLLIAFVVLGSWKILNLLGFFV